MKSLIVRWCVDTRKCWCCAAGQRRGIRISTAEGSRLALEALLPVLVRQLVPRAADARKRGLARARWVKPRGARERKSSSSPLKGFEVRKRTGVNSPTPWNICFPVRANTYDISGAAISSTPRTKIGGETTEAGRQERADAAKGMNGTHGNANGKVVSRVDPTDVFFDAA